MARYVIELDRSLCSGFGACVDHAPGAIAVEKGTAVLLSAGSDDDAVLDAAASCPMGALVVLDGATGEQVA